MVQIAQRGSATKKATPSNILVVYINCSWLDPILIPNGAPFERLQCKPLGDIWL